VRSPLVGGGKAWTSANLADGSRIFPCTPPSLGPVVFLCLEYITPVPSSEASWHPTFGSTGLRSVSGGPILAWPYLDFLLFPWKMEAVSTESEAHGLSLCRFCVSAYVLVTV
jgi:hypothetical protein